MRERASGTGRRDKHTSAYVSIVQYTLAYFSIERASGTGRRDMKPKQLHLEYRSKCAIHWSDQKRSTTPDVSIRQHTSASVSIQNSCS